jgi:hypothetical protein
LYLFDKVGERKATKDEGLSVGPLGAATPNQSRMAWGYHSQGFRELSEDERADLTVQSRRWRQIRLRFLIGAWIATFATIFGFMVGYGEDRLWGYGVCCVGLLSAALCALLRGDAKRREAVLKTELADGRIETFIAPDQTELESRESFELYAGSGRLHSAEHADPIFNPSVQPRDVAQIPQTRVLATMPPRIDFNPSGAVVKLRKLTEEELAELARIEIAIPRASAWSALGAIYVLARVATWTKSMHGRPVPLWEALLLLLALSTIAFFGFKLFQRAKFVGGIQKDMRQGEVASSAAAHTEPGMGLEYLPNALVAWTIDGRPAPWRSS